MVLVAGSVYFLFSYFFPDIQINKYSNIAAVHDQQAIQKGWIPAILPESAYEIAETHNLDTGDIFGAFKYKEKDEKSFIQYLSMLNDEKHTFEWGNFLFRIDREQNKVKFRNKPDKQQH